MEKQKISEIKYTEKITKRERDKSGALVPVEKNYVRFKEVPQVDGWARFGHYLLDTIIYYVFSIIIAIPIVFILMAMGVNVAEFDDTSSGVSIIERLVSILILYPGYYILFESTMQSTPGKLILGRIVVDEYGEKPTFKQIIQRNYGRIVPFEFFSCLGGRGWHDTWSDTYVLRKKDLQDLKLAMQISQIDVIPTEPEKI